MQTTIETELTRRTWQSWKHNRTRPKLTYLELLKLAMHLTKVCRMQNIDPQEIDFRSLLDSSLNYYENLDALDVQLHQLGVCNLADYSGYFGIGTEKLRLKLQLLRTSYRHLKQRLDKEKRKTERLKTKLKKRRKHGKKR